MKEIQDIERVIIGLGNPGKKYDETRHNIGARIVEAYASSYEAVWTVDKSLYAKFSICLLEGKKTLLATPTIYMNDNGKMTYSIVKRTAISPNSLLVVLDDIETSFGSCSIAYNGGSRGHNGIRSIHAFLQRKDFSQLRFGVDRPSHEEVAEYVLSPFTSEENSVLEGYIAKAQDMIHDWINRKG